MGYILETEDDLSLERISESGQCFRWEKLDEDTYRVPHLSYCLIIKRVGEGRFRLSCDSGEYESIWRPYLDMDTDYRSIRSLVRKEEDAFLYDACEYGRGIRILRQDPWETLISFIISQNRNIPAIKRSVEMLCREAGNEKRDAEGRVYFTFPSPEGIISMKDEKLNECRLGYRCGYVRAAAEAVASGRIVLSELAGRSEEETVRVLTSLYGVGPKVASCMSLFGLHHVDAFPIDVWIRRILEREYPEGYPMEKYRPYNGIYQQYMFYYYRENNGQVG